MIAQVRDRMVLVQVKVERSNLAMGLLVLCVLLLLLSAGEKVHKSSLNFRLVDKSEVDVIKTFYHTL